MLTIDECRKILGDADLTDEQIEEMRNSLYCLSEHFINKYLKEMAEGKCELNSNCKMSKKL